MNKLTLKTEVNVLPDRSEMGRVAGMAVEQKIIDLLKEKDEIRMIFAAAPSQNEVLAYLAASSTIDWSKIVAFHMDEYIGLSAGAPQLFSEFLNEAIFKKVPFKQVFRIDGTSNSDDEVIRYSKLLNEAPIDIVCMGIGENGHIAFNDPPVADFNDPAKMKRVELDLACRQQQVNDGCFPSLDAVPRGALTLTVSALMRGGHLFCVVPGTTKSEAVYKTLYGPIETQCPASILRTHPDCKFYFDRDSYKEL